MIEDLKTQLESKLNDIILSKNMVSVAQIQIKELINANKQFLKEKN